MSSCSSNSSKVEQGEGTAITAVHPDIIQTHILTRLDGPTLASTTCASSHLRALSNEDRLWRDLCNSSWPSTGNPLVRDTISTFPTGHRSLYSDCFPTFHHRNPRCRHCHHRVPSTSELISAIDIHYQNQLIFSKVEVTETISGWFQCSPLRINLLDPKETVATPVKFESDEESLIQLEKCMSLSWILIDSTQKRAVNISSLNPVLVNRHWLTGDIQLQYATVMSGYGSPELVQCKVEVTCGGNEGGELHVREVSMCVEDMDGKILCGKDSLAILHEAMNSERRRRRRGDERNRYEQYETLEREKRVRKYRRERRLDMAFTVAGFTIFMIFWLFIYLIFLNH